MGNNMASEKERITILMSPHEKKRLVSRAQHAGLSVSAYLRLAADSYYTAQDETNLCLLLKQMNLATERAERAIDETLEFVRDSNQRIAKMESRAPETKGN